MKVKQIRSKWAFVLMGLMGLVSASQAQSNVTIYGIVDAGVTVVNNAGGSSQKLLDTGIMQGNRLGFRGSEELGGGLSAIFAIEMGYALDTGALGQGGLAFGRQSWVGLSDARLGTLTFGRQYDFMYESLGGYYTPTWSAGGYANKPLDNDRVSGQRVNNAVKYKSQSLGGFSFGAMHALSELAGNASGPGRTTSLGANYASGPVSVGAAYTDVRGATIDIRPLVGSSTAVTLGGDYSRSLGVGATYKPTDKTTLYTIYTQSKFAGPAATADGTFRNYEGGFAYRTGQWNFGFGYALTTLRDSVRDNKYHQGNLTADYFLSQRTDVYAQTIFQHAVGDTARAAIISMPGSSTHNQALVRVGIRHRF